MQINTGRVGFRQKFIGDKSFYKMTLAIAVPIMVQNAISNFVSLLDNVMVGRLGTEPMSGVSIINTLIFIYYLAIFGGVGGVGIFTAQYYGNKDNEGIRHTFRYKIWLSVIVTALCLFLLIAFDKELIGLYLTDSGDGSSLEETLRCGQEYLKIILLSFPAFMILQVYASTIRECGETVLPMKAGITAVILNLVFNYLLIYGKLGFPELGVRGAAIATVLSRYVEALIVVVWTHRHTDRNPFIVGVYRTLKVPAALVARYFKKGIVLMANETLWSVGMALLTQCYSLRGLNVIAGMNIANTITNMFTITYFAMGDAVAIIVGQKLGAGKLEEAKDTDNKLIAFAVFLGICTALIVSVFAPLFPDLYNTTPEVKEIAMGCLYVTAVFMPTVAFLHSAYFTLRSGGKTFITFLFDSGFIWCVSVPAALAVTRLTDLPIIPVYMIIYSLDLIKCVVGYIMVRKNIWINNIVAEDAG